MEGQARGVLGAPSCCRFSVWLPSYFSFLPVYVCAVIFEDDLRLLGFQELLEDGQMDQFHKALVELNMDSPEELQSYIQKLSSAVEQAKQKILQAEVTLEVDVVDSKPEVPRALGAGSRRVLQPEGGRGVWRRLTSKRRDHSWESSMVSAVHGDRRGAEMALTLC